MVMRAFLAAGLLMLSSGASLAQGVDWSGAYGGLSLGAVRSDVSLAFPGTGFMGDHNGSGAIAAAQLGYNWTLPSGLGVGVELDAAAGKVDSAGPVTLGGAPLEHWPVEVSRMMALKARLGWATSNSTMVYGTLGAARADVDGDIYDDLAGTVYRESYSGKLNGWTAAIGVEHAIRQNVSVTGELRHTRYGTEAFDLPGTIPFEVDVKTTEVRLGVNFHF
jgi:opacity protein-like surface antigen